MNIHIANCACNDDTLARENRYLGLPQVGLVPGVGDDVELGVGDDLRPGVRHRGDVDPEVVDEVGR